ncbi:hypothetical protein FA13DRAFT_1599009, partial [Coprinellus micaceus]
TVLAARSPAMAPAAPRTASVAPQEPHRCDPLDKFFGYRLATHESRHDRSSVAQAEEALPAYVEKDYSLPAYTATYEPATLAMYLFKFGFLFFPFWIFGAFILLSPLREPPISEASPVWMPEKTEEERRQILEKMRTVEIKWAKRCLYALVALALLATVAGVAAWAFFVRR